MIFTSQKNMPFSNRVQVQHNHYSCVEFETLKSASNHYTCTSISHQQHSQTFQPSRFIISPYIVIWNIISALDNCYDFISADMDYTWIQTDERTLQRRNSHSFISMDLFNLLSWLSHRISLVMLTVLGSWTKIDICW